MNYRHQFHAGNFADVVKHSLLLRLVRALQKKPAGFLYLDSHAGRGRYDLQRAETGDSLARQPEWPDGIGRLWSRPAGELPSPVAEYVALVRDFDRQAGNLGETPRFYPGSPQIARLLARPVDRLALCEKHPAEFAALRAEFAPGARRAGRGEAPPRAAVHEMDGYTALRAMLPPPERRALALVDAPFEAQDEFAQIVTALGEALRRFRTGVYAIWYPLTGRARVDEFFSALGELDLPSALAAEVAVTGDDSPVKLKGCGVAIVNPPWELDREIEPALAYLAEALALGPGGGSRVTWLKRA